MTEKMIRIFKGYKLKNMYVAYSIDRSNGDKDTGGNKLIKFHWLNH